TIRAKGASYAPAMGSSRDVFAAASRSRTADKSCSATICFAHQPVLSQRSSCEFRQARSHSHACLDEHRRRYPWELGSDLLGREPSARASSLGAVSSGGWHYRASHLCPTSVCLGEVVSMSRSSRGLGWPSRSVLSR